MFAWAETLMEYSGRLKEVRRTGWVKRGVPEPESVADHTYRIVLLALTYAPVRGLDTSRCVAMAIIHDLPEAITGDIVALTPNEKARKWELERQAIQCIFSEYPEGDYFTQLFEEYLEQKSPVAQFVKELDKLDTGKQAKRYMEIYPELDLNELVREAEAHLANSDLLELL